MGFYKPKLSGIEHLGMLLSVNGTSSFHSHQIDYNLAAHTAVNWRMGAQLYTVISDEELQDRFCVEAIQQLQRSYLAITMRNRVLRRRTVDVLDAMLSKNLQPVILKGGIELLKSPNNGDCSRFMEDVDILVAPEVYLLSISIAIENGFLVHSKNSYHTCMRDGDTGIEIEIHKRPSRKEYVRYYDGLISESEIETTKEGLEISVPSRRYQLLHNVIHAQDHHDSFLLGNSDIRQIYDFAKVFSAVEVEGEWKWLMRAAESFGLRRHLLAWAYAAHRIFAMRYPSDEPTKWIERNQFRRIRQFETRGRFGALLDRFVHINALALQRELGVDQLAQQYRYWAYRLLRMEK